MVYQMLWNCWNAANCLYPVHFFLLFPGFKQFQQIIIMRYSWSHYTAVSVYVGEQLHKMVLIFNWCFNIILCSATKFHQSLFCVTI